MADLGAVVLVEYRIGLAAVFLMIVAMFLHKPLNLRQHWRHYLVLGIFNAALPFILFGFAALTLTASALSILNATTTIWGAVIGAVWSRQPLSGRTVLGLGLGVAGVGLIVGFDHWGAQPGAGIANAHGSIWAASLFIVPALPFASVTTAPGTGVMLAVIALGVVCAGVAFLLYFRLVRDIGGTSTLTVTFLIPVFGILWGHLFLGEAVTQSMIAGSLIVIFGTALSTEFNPAALFLRLKC